MENMSRGVKQEVLSKHVVHYRKRVVGAMGMYCQYM